MRPIGLGFQTVGNATLICYDGGPVLAPEPRNQPIQLIDVRDLADWILTAAEAGVSGPLNATGDPGALTMGSMLDTIAAVVGRQGAVGGVGRHGGEDCCRGLPAALHTLEAVRDGDELSWQYAFARRTTLPVEGHLDGETVWSTEQVGYDAFNQIRYR